MSIDKHNSRSPGRSKTACKGAENRGPESPSRATKSETDTRPRARKAILIRREPGSTRITLTAKGRRLLEDATADGVSLGVIARRLGVGRRTLQDIARREPEVQDAIDQGNARNETELRNALMEKARKGNVTAAIYLTKARHGWREGDAPEDRPNVIINLPGAMSPEEYIKTVNARELKHDDPESSS